MVAFRAKPGSEIFYSWNPQASRLIYIMGDFTETNFDCTQKVKIISNLGGI